MSERAILFSGEMVRAILDGRKTQTRRVVTVTCGCNYNDYAGSWKSARVQPSRLRDADRTIWWYESVHGTSEPARCPYGVPGDLLWVRETWALTPKGTPFYRADIECVENLSVVGGWRSSMFMPRWASRLALRVKSVRPERVQDISEEDAKAEGAEKMCLDDLGNTWATHQRGFQSLWDRINAKRGYGWDQNPWVWRIEFAKEGEA